MFGHAEAAVHLYRLVQQAAGLLTVADNPYICSGKIPSFGAARSAAAPSSGRTHRAVRLTVGDPAASPVSGLKMASSAGMSTWE